MHFRQRYRRLAAWISAACLLACAAACSGSASSEKDESIPKEEEASMSGYDQLFSALDRSPITNRWGKVKPQPLAVDTVTVFSAEPGAQYNHHPQITAWRGRLYATWSSGLIHEDFPGQQMVMAVSEDGGNSWSNPTVVAGSAIGGQPGVVTNAGIHTFEDTMVAYYSYYRYDEQGMQLLEDYTDSRSPLPEQLDAHTGMRISRDRGETWSEPAGRIDRLTANLCPQRLQNGRLLLPGHATFFTTDDPLGLTGWERGSLPGVPAGYTDSPNGLYAAAQAMKLEGVAFCEASCYQTADGVIHMMLRTLIDADRISPNPYVLAVSESRDQGKSWSKPMLTQFSDCGSKCQFGTLPDGRYFCISCPQPGSGRTPLVLALSEDGAVFDQQFIIGSDKEHPPRYPGRHKGGLYGYPTCAVSEDILYVIYSLEKEDIVVSRIRLEDLR